MYHRNKMSSDEQIVAQWLKRTEMERRLKIMLAHNKREREKDDLKIIEICRRSPTTAIDVHPENSKEALVFGPHGKIHLVPFDTKESKLNQKRDKLTLDNHVFQLSRAAIEHVLSTANAPHLLEAMLEEEKRLIADKAEKSAKKSSSSQPTLIPQRVYVTTDNPKRKRKMDDDGFSKSCRGKQGQFEKKQIEHWMDACDRALSSTPEASRVQDSRVLYSNA